MRIWEDLMLSVINKSIIGILFLTTIILCSGCEYNSANSKLLPETAWGHGEDNDLPWAFESVCVREPKCGDTHFGIGEHHYEVHFTKFDSPEKAKARLMEAVKNSFQIVEQASIINDAGISVGEKFLLNGSTGNYKWFYMMTWTRGSRFAYVTAESLEAIRAYEADRNL